MSASVLALFLLLSRRNVDLQLKDVLSEKTGQAGLALERAGSLPVKDGLAPATIETGAAASGKLYQLDFVPDVFGTSKVVEDKAHFFQVKIRFERPLFFWLEMRLKVFKGFCPLPVLSVQCRPVARLYPKLKQGHPL